MGGKLELLMDKRLNKGFTLVEVLIVLLCVVSLTILFNISWQKIEFNHLNPTHLQLKAMATKQKVSFTKTLHFNENGNINRAQTIKLNNKDCVFQLGMGRFYCE